MLLTSLLTAALVGGTLLVRNHMRLTEMARSYLLAEADVVALQSSRPLWAGDVETTERKLAALAAIEEIGAVSIYDIEGRLFARYVRAGEAFSNLVPGFAKRKQEQWLILDEKPIEYEGIRVGMLEMAYDLRPINARLRRSVMAGLCIAALAAAASLLVSLRLQQALAKPITSLVQSAEHVARTQEFSHRATKHSDDELGNLTLVFNSMLEEIELFDAERTALLESEQAARAEAERATQIKDEFVATLSHELRTPLTAILGWTQMLRRPAGLPAIQVDEALATIERNTRLQMQMVEDLLDMSRILSGKLRMDIRPVALAAVIDAAIGTVQCAADAKHIELVRKVDSDVGQVLGDVDRLQQVVWNFLSNAVKFTPTGGRVSVSLMQRRRIAIIEVSDTGPGIEPAFLPHVFERFSQAEGGQTRGHNGLGLGLSIVKQIVELHGGTVHAASEGIGHGATFTVELPLI